jgi:hypothetical protein
MVTEAFPSGNMGKDVIANEAIPAECVSGFASGIAENKER